MPVASDPPPIAARPPKLPRRHCWMLVAAFEMLVLGVTLSVLWPIHPPGVSVEQTLKPNHMVT